MLHLPTLAYNLGRVTACTCDPAVNMRSVLMHCTNVSEVPGYIAQMFPEVR